jgi:hypothetical protein
MVTSFARERPLVQLEDHHCEPTGRREAPPDDRLREAIQLCCREEGKLDCFVASAFARRRASADRSAPRNDAKAQLLVLAARKRPGYAKNLVPLKRGRRECRALDAPDSRVCNGSGRTHTRCQVTPESPGIPHAMVYGLFRVLPGARALWSPSPVELLPRTWRQRRGVRTTRLRRPHQMPSSEAPSASTASRPALVTIAKRPSSGTGRLRI